MSVTVTLPEFCISKAAVGRRLSSVILRSQEACLGPDQFADTVNAVLAMCSTGTGDTTLYPNADIAILEAEYAEIRKSIRRSEIARKAAARRRELREQRMKAAEMEKNNVDPGINDTAGKAAVTPALEEKAEPTPSSDQERSVTEADQQLSADPEAKPRKRRRRNRRRRRNKGNNLVSQNPITLA